MTEKRTAAAARRRRKRKRLHWLHIIRAIVAFGIVLGLAILIFLLTHSLSPANTGSSNSSRKNNSGQPSQAIKGGKVTQTVSAVLQKSGFSTLRNGYIDLNTMISKIDSNYSLDDQMVNSSDSKSQDSAAPFLAAHAENGVVLLIEKVGTYSGNDAYDLFATGSNYQKTGAAGAAVQDSQKAVDDLKDEIYNSTDSSYLTKAETTAFPSLKGVIYIVNHLHASKGIIVKSSS